MKTSISATNFSLTPFINKAIKEKLGSIPDIDNIIRRIDIVLTKKKFSKAEILLKDTSGTTIKVKSTDDSLYNCISKSFKKLKSIIKRQKYSKK